MPTPPAPRIVVGAAIVDDLETPTMLLTARRTEPPALAGGWELPGGKVEPGESLTEALHRELREELGVSVELGGHVDGPVDTEAGGAWPLPSGWVMHVWLAVVRDGQPAPLEDHDELRWLGPGPDRWGEVAWLPADGPILEALAALADRGRHRVSMSPRHT